MCVRSKSIEYGKCNQNFEHLKGHIVFVKKKKKKENGQMGKMKD